VWMVLVNSSMMHQMLAAQLLDFEAFTLDGM
jgi:hypothetical protein